MNKVIGEFISSQQPYPQLIAKVVFEVILNLDFLKDSMLNKQRQSSTPFPALGLKKKKR